MVSRQNNEEKEMEEVKGHSETSIIGNSMSKWINNEAITAPILSMEFINGGLIKFNDADSSLWKNAKIYRNGVHTTVKWGDGTITRVKLTEGEEGNDIDAFLNALGKKLFGSRTALKRFVEQNTVVQKKKEKKVKVPERYKPENLDGRGQQVNVGDAVFLNGRIFNGIPEKGKICKVNKVEGCYIWVDGVDFDGHGVFASGVTKVRVEPPYSAGDYVVFCNPEEEYLVHSAYWIPGYMVEDIPERIEEIKPFSDAKELNLKCNGFYYDPLWVRGLDT
jgi:hypothetical protein